MKKSEHSFFKLKKDGEESEEKVQEGPWPFTRKTGFLSGRKNFNH